VSLQAKIESIITVLKRETLRKFTYDMETMQELDPHAYRITMICLQGWYLRDKDFVYNRKIDHGTPAIIRHIESKTSYRFPENIVVRTKQYPHACSLADIAFCTEARVKEQKNFLVDLHQPSSTDREKIFKEIPPSAHLIERAILAYLDQIDALEKETPKQRRKRIYKKAFELCASSQPADDDQMAE